MAILESFQGGGTGRWILIKKELKKQEEEFEKFKDDDEGVVSDESTKELNYLKENLTYLNELLPTINSGNLQQNIDRCKEAMVAIDKKAMVFQVGIILYQRVMGKHPFIEEGASPLQYLQYQHCDDSIKTFQMANDSLREALPMKGNFADLIMGMLEPIYDQRLNCEKAMEKLETLIAADNQLVQLIKSKKPKHGLFK